MSMTTPGRVNAAGRMKAFIPKLARATLPSSLYGWSRETPKDVTRTVQGAIRMNTPPSEIFVDISKNFARGNIKVQLQFLASLDDPGVTGYTALLADANGEEAQVYKGMEATANMTRKAVPMRGDGPNAHEVSGYNGKAAVTGQLGQWGQDDVERSIRAAIVERVAPSLEAAPASLTIGVHPIVFVATNLVSTSQPADSYSVTAATWANVIGTAADNIPSGKEGGLTYNNLANLSELVKTYRLRKLNLSRGKGWIVSISERGMQQLRRDPDLKLALQHGDVRGPANQLFAGVKGPIDGFYFWEDERLPRLAVAGAAGSKTVTWSYYAHGKTDNRTGDFDACIIHGAGAIVRGNAIPPHFVDEDEDYGVNEGMGLSFTQCVMRLQYDIASPVAGSYEIDGSALFLTRRDADMGS